MMKNLSAVIVAARSGRRLRTPIPMLPFGETTVLGRTLRAYLDAKFTEVIVVLGHRGEEIRASLGDLAAKVVTVQAPAGDEPYADYLRLGVERLSSSAKAFAIGRGDQPLLGKEALEELGTAFVAAKGKILVPTWQGALGHPVFFDVSFAGDFRRLAAPAETWEVIRAHSEQVEDREVQYTSVIQGIEDRDGYIEALRAAGLPVPEPTPREEPAGIAGTGIAGNGTPGEGPLGPVSFGG
jgi:molybdenum cofactor cytidylyltransferase